MTEFLFGSVVFLSATIFILCTIWTAVIYGRVLHYRSIGYVRAKMTIGTSFIAVWAVSASILFGCLITKGVM